MTSISGTKYAIHRQRLRQLGNRSHATRSEILWSARYDFLNAAVQIEPALFWSLFPTEEEYAGLGLAPMVEGWPDEKIERVEAWLALRGTTAQLFRADWQTRFRLPDEWCWQAALATMGTQWPIAPPPDWDDSSKGICTGIMQYPNPQIIPYQGAIRPQDHTYMQWVPEHESKKAARNRIMLAVEAELDRIEREKHLEPVPQKEHRHYGRLAKYVIGRKSTYDIALEWKPELREWRMGPEHRRAARAVESSIKKTAALIGLTLPSR